MPTDEELTLDGKPADSGTNGRIPSIDLFRTIAVFAVVVIHTTPFRYAEAGSALDLLGVGVVHACRFAVPFFFVVSGYLWGRSVALKRTKAEAYRRSATRLLLLFVIWSMFYGVSLVDTGSLSELGVIGWCGSAVDSVVGLFRKHWLMLAFQGTRVHLWFLMGLLWGMTIVALASTTRRNWVIIGIGVVLYLIGLVAGPYATLLMDWQPTFNTRNGPFFSTLFFGIGYVLSSIKIRPSFRVGLGLAVFGLLLQLAESCLLACTTTTDPVRYGFFLGTVPFGIGVAVLCLAAGNVCGEGRLGKWGRYTLGVYLFHPYIVEKLQRTDAKLSFPVWDLAYPLIVYFVSLAVVYGISKVPVARRAVS